MEAADRHDGPRRARRTERRVVGVAGAQRAEEAEHVRLGDRSGRIDSAAVQVSGVTPEIAPVAVQRVVGQAAFDPQVAQIVEHRPLEVGGHQSRDRRTCSASSAATVMPSVIRPSSTASTAASNGQPPLLHVGLFGVPVRAIGVRNGVQAGRPEHRPPLGGVAGRGEQPELLDPLIGGQVGLLGELADGRRRAGPPPPRRGCRRGSPASGAVPGAGTARRAGRGRRSSTRQNSHRAVRLHDDAVVLPRVGVDDRVDVDPQVVGWRSPASTS